MLSKTLESAFAPGVGKDPIRDNLGGAMLKELRQAMTDCTMAAHLGMPERITPDTIRAICTAVEWLEDVFDELENKR